MNTLLLNEPPAPPIEETVRSVSLLRGERHRILKDIHEILTGWYARGAVSIAIAGVPAFGTAEQCIETLEHSRLDEIRRVYRLLIGKR